MTTMFRTLWRDEYGLVTPTESVAIVALLVVGIFAGIRALPASAVAESRFDEAAYAGNFQSDARDQVFTGRRAYRAAWTGNAGFVNVDDPAVAEDVPPVTYEVHPYPVSPMSFIPYEATSPCYGPYASGNAGGAFGYRFPPGAVMDGCHGHYGPMGGDGFHGCTCPTVNGCENACAPSPCTAAGCCDKQSSCGVCGTCATSSRCTSSCNSGCSGVLEVATPCGCTPRPVLPPLVCPPLSLYRPGCLDDTLDVECQELITLYPCSPCAPTNCRVIW
ncbi:MAG: hypothetical protein KF861_14135 [Planctomycetaceae bacterium]|nr:hypothetical protein [Planctomycetaceae bacterium]